MVSLVEDKIKTIMEDELFTHSEIEEAKRFYGEGEHTILSQGKEKITVLVANGEEHTVQIAVNGEEELFQKTNDRLTEWDVYGLTALFVIANKCKDETLSEGIKYTREGMIKRVIEERYDRAKKADYKVVLANNLHGEHILTNEKGKSYRITLRDFENKTGYINNIDWRTNKLGTTKHIMYLFNYLENNPSKTRKMDKKYPFIEIFTDPLNDYRITWYYPETLRTEERKLLTSYFGNKNHIGDSQIAGFFSFVHKSRDLERIKIRQEVFEKVEAYFEKNELEQKKQNTTLDFSSIRATLYPYQKEGVEFAAFKEGVIIADEMGLGKTLQAIATAVLKKEIFDFGKTLVICPASVKSQWKNEVLKFTNEQAIVVEGLPEERNQMYLNDPSFFHIINYETVLRDLPVINKVGYDFIILDEAQKIKNYETKTANAVKAIHKKHALVITGTPLENKLLDLYSIVQFLDPYYLAPQWEFSYQHCVFDTNSKNKIRGYYNLQELKARLEPILIRREKRDVFEQLPNVIQKNVFVSLSDEQAGLHASFARGIASILGKKFKTTYDWQKLMHLLTNMRMVCNSTYLIDKETHISPKLVELREILLENLDVKNNKRKIIIFSEWVTMLNLIGEMLKKEGITYTILTGKVPVKKRGALIKEFEDNPDCSIFLSSESGGTGLNLQVADTVINFELPWNPAKKNQRIGRIDRIGQKKQTLHVFNLLSYDSIEMKIATGLVLKQNLFEGVLNSESLTDNVDFSDKGKSQFIQQLEEVLGKDDELSPKGKDASNFEFQEEDTLLELTTEPVQTNLFEDNELNKKVRNPKSQNFQTTAAKNENNGKNITDLEQMEAVMTKGMEFLTGIYKMGTGKDIAAAGKPKVSVNKESGEVSITFKMEL
ncbi:DEAD/DEAH box helicase [Aequorivita viscosa]|uniref:Superfamily II DNA or RNA helicase, SNF2 family n=1 Tax=Aequorivita viscosa TaxID=797419 RepID=A0A1M6GXV4_9FLAO|nr:DEAD/DEAH box helicase [Aequorivita viscosa]SDW79778.1 Superfamily II DNA or RNA helicase, SNF2 family [Aequorivita viscosa]SHJ14799.1 Superfamily II DNA or RNA helicase, SNF2 family [Aequorivita viscosa]